MNTIELAPLYDVHVGSRELDEELLDRHLDWIARTPNVFTWNGGDAFENKTPHEGHMGADPMNPEEQLLAVTEKFAKVQSKMLFAIPGNHEDRTFKQSGMSSSKRLADNLKIPYFKDYAMVSMKWRGKQLPPPGSSRRMRRCADPRSAAQFSSKRVNLVSSGSPVDWPLASADDRHGQGI